VAACRYAVIIHLTRRGQNQSIGQPLESANKVVLELNRPIDCLLSLERLLLKEYNIRPHSALRDMRVIYFIGLPCSWFNWLVLYSCTVAKSLDSRFSSLDQQGCPLARHRVTELVLRQCHNPTHSVQSGVAYCDATRVI